MATTINERRALYEALRNQRPGEKVNLKVLRKNRVHQIEIPAIRAEDYFG